MAGDFPAGYRKEASRLPAEASFLPFFCNHPPPWRPLKTDNSTDIVYASLCVREAYITPCPDISGAKGEASMPPPSPRTPLPPLKGMLSMVGGFRSGTVAPRPQGAANCGRMSERMPEASGHPV
jgi:hypothetical protein